MALYGLAFDASYVAASIPLFVSFEVGVINALRWFRFFATGWHRAFIAVLWIEVVVYLAPEIVIAVKPRPSANEDIRAKPFWPVISGRRAVIRNGVIVTVGTVRGYPDLYSGLSLCFGGGYREATSSYRGQDQKCKSTHKSTFSMSV
jgi:hypothetical protein